MDAPNTIIWRWLSLQLLLIFMLSIGVALVSPSSPLVRLVVLGDWGADPSDVRAVNEQKAVAAALSALQRQHPFSKIIHVGDNFYDDGLANSTDPKFRTAFTDILQPFDNLRTVPWYSTLGNHDYMGDTQAQINRSDDKRFVMESRNFMLRVNMEGGGALADLFFIDTNPSIVEYHTHPETPRQHDELSTQHWDSTLRWLSEGLRHSSAPFRLVVGHHPMFCSKDDHNFIEMQMALLPLFNEYGVQLYYSGHYHDMEFSESNGMDFILSGAGSQVKDSSFGADTTSRKRKLHKRHPHGHKHSMNSSSSSVLPPGYVNVNDPAKTTKFQSFTVGFVMVEINEDEITNVFLDTKLNRLYEAKTRKEEVCNDGHPPGMRKEKMEEPHRPSVRLDVEVES